MSSSLLELLKNHLIVFNVGFLMFMDIPAWFTTLPTSNKAESLNLSIIFVVLTIEVFVPQRRSKILLMEYYLKGKSW